MQECIQKQYIRENVFHRNMFFCIYGKGKVSHGKEIIYKTMFLVFMEK